MWFMLRVIGVLCGEKEAETSFGEECRFGWDCAENRGVVSVGSKRAVFSLFL